MEQVNLEILEQQSGAPTGFIVDMLNGKNNDWEFVIKTHALLEGLVTSLISWRLDSSPGKSVAPVVERLDLGDVQRGKLAFAKHLELLTPEFVKYIQKICEVRNKLVHKIENVNFSLSKYIESLDSNQLKELKRTLGAYIDDSSKADFEKLLKSNPQMAFFHMTYLMHGPIQLERARVLYEGVEKKLHARAHSFYMQVQEMLKEKSV